MKEEEITTVDINNLSTVAIPPVIEGGSGSVYRDAYDQSRPDVEVWDGSTDDLPLDVFSRVFAAGWGDIDAARENRRKMSSAQAAQKGVHVFTTGQLVFGALVLLVACILFAAAMIGTYSWMTEKVGVC